MSTPSAPPPGAKRRLPVFGQSADGPEPPPAERPRWQWILIGALATVLGWLLLAMIVNWIVRPPVSETAPPSALRMGVLVGANAAALAIAAAGGGYLTGRFGKGATLRDGTFAGGAAGVLGGVLAFPTSAGSGTNAFAWILVVFVLVTIGGAGGRFGARFGMKHRGPWTE